MKKTGKKNYLLNFLILLISIVISLIAAEIFLRLRTEDNLSFYSNLESSKLQSMGVKTSGNISKEYFEHISTFNKNTWHLPNSEWFWAGQLGRQVEFFIQSHWNNLACNDPKDYLNDPGKDSLLILGDSFVEALQVPHEYTFYSMLKNDLASKNINVWGCGWSGWSPVYAHMNLNPAMPAKEGLEIGGKFPGLENLKPKWVIYIIYLGNDLRNEAAYSFKAFNEANKEKIEACPGVPKTPSIVLNKILHFYYMYIRKPEGNLICAMDELWPYLDFNHPTVQEGMKNMRRSLEDLKSDLGARNAKLSVGIIEPYPVAYGRELFKENLKFSFPDTQDMKFDLKAPSESVERMLEELKIPYVNFSKGFARGAQKKHYLKSDLHLSQMGHESLRHQIRNKLESLLQLSDAERTAGFENSVP